MNLSKTTRKFLSRTAVPATFVMALTVPWGCAARHHYQMVPHTTCLLGAKKGQTIATVRCLYALHPIFSSHRLTVTVGSSSGQCKEYWPARWCTNG